MSKVWAASFQLPDAYHINNCTMIFIDHTQRRKRDTTFDGCPHLFRTYSPLLLYCLGYFVSSEFDLTNERLDLLEEPAQ